MPFVCRLWQKRDSSQNRPLKEQLEPVGIPRSISASSARKSVSLTDHASSHAHRGTRPAECSHRARRAADVARAIASKIATACPSALAAPATAASRFSCGTQVDSRDGRPSELPPRQTVHKTHDCEEAPQSQRTARQQGHKYDGRLNSKNLLHSTSVEIF